MTLRRPRPGDTVIVRLTPDVEVIGTVRAYFTSLPWHLDKEDGVVWYAGKPIVRQWTIDLDNGNVATIANRSDMTVIDARNLPVHLATSGVATMCADD